MTNKSEEELTEKKGILKALIGNTAWKEKDVIKIGKRLLFIFLIIVELLILIPLIARSVKTGKWSFFISALGIELVLTISEAVKYFKLKEFKTKIYCYVIDFVATFVLTTVTGSSYIITLYMMILTEYYASCEKFMGSFIGFLMCLIIYVVTYGIIASFGSGEVISIVGIITQCFNAIVIFLIHFVLVNYAIRYYRMYGKMKNAMIELDKSKKELQKAYDDLAEVTALEERQRIAKEIHDTAGHSMTTVIMQTEAAKLIIDKDPQDAKKKIIAANIQAKHALEELRENVHVLSGKENHPRLKTELEKIISESMDGTGIKIRSDIDDVTTSEDKQRLISNALKEGISNGLRHGGATAFYVELKRDENFITFLLSDNGSGVSMDKLKKGFGLNGMVSQVEKSGGRIKFESEEDEGFEIKIQLSI